MDGRGLPRVGEGGEQVGMSDHAGALSGVEGDFLEFTALDGLAVEFAEPLVEQQVVGLEQLAVVGGLAPHHIIHKAQQGLAQVGQHSLVETGEGLRILRGALGVLQVQPVVEEAVQLGPRARVRHHAPRLGADLLGSAQPPLGGCLPEALVREGIPQRQCQAGGGLKVVGLFPGADPRIDELRRLQGKKHHALHGGLRRRRGLELSLDVEILLLIGERTPEGGLDKDAGELAQLFRTVGRAGFGLRQLVEILHHMLGGGDGGLGDRLLPFFGNGRAALVARAAVVGGEAGVNDHQLARARAARGTRGQQLPHAVRRPPPQLKGGGCLLEFEMLQQELVGAPSDEEDAFFLLAHLRPCAYPAVNERVRLVVVIDPETEAVFRLHRKLMHPCLARNDAAFKAALELLRLQRLGHGAALAPVKGDHRLHALDGFVGPLFLDAVLRCRVHRLFPRLRQLHAAVDGLQPRLAPERAVEARAHAEAPDEVGHAVAVLRRCEARQIPRGRVDARLRLRRVKGVVDVLGHRFRVFAHAGVLVVLRHRLFDLARQCLKRSLADERLVIPSLHALAAVAVAFEALFVIDGLPGMRRLRRESG